MAELEQYLTRIKENPSPLLEVIQLVQNTLDTNSDKFGCIVENNGYYNRIISLSRFSSGGEIHDLQIELIRKNETKEIKQEIDLLSPKTGETVYRLDMNFGVEDKIGEIANNLAIIPELRSFVDSHLTGYAYLTADTLVELNDHWAEVTVSADEVKQILENGFDFQIPKVPRIQCTYRELKNYLAQRGGKLSVSNLLELI